MSRARSEHVLNMSWTYSEHTRNMSRMCPEHVQNMLNTCQTNVNIMFQRMSKTILGRMLDAVLGVMHELMSGLLLDSYPV